MYNLKVTCLVSGGKDSVLALWLALHQFEVVSILTIRSSCFDSYLFHIPNCEHVDLIARMLGIPHKVVWIDSCNVEDEIQILEESFKQSSSETVITGGIRSEFQRYKFNQAAKLADMKCFSPLWRLSPSVIMSELLENKFNVIITSVSGMGLGKGLLGKKITKETLSTFKRGVSESPLTLIGEGGEYESFVLDAPFYHSQIEIIESEIQWDEYREEGIFVIKKAKLSPKRKNLP